MMILSFEKLDQDNSVKLKQHAEYLDNTSFCSKTIVRTLDTHTPDRFLYLDHHTHQT